MKISEFLEKFTASHLIQSAEPMQAEFEKQTGMDFKLPTHPAEETRDAIDARGLGGYCNGSAQVVWGYEIACALADKFGKGTLHRTLSGRGGKFTAAIHSLQAAGH